MIKEKLLYISMSLEKSNYGGSIVSRANLKALKTNERLEIKRDRDRQERGGCFYEWEMLAKNSKIQTALNNLRGYAGRLNAEIFSRIKELFMSISQPRYILIQACWVAWPNGVRARTQLSRF
jgi:hypothetical protein